ncbi:MAG: hypothetical protein HKP40_00275 [Litoreibacter sp.]|nr:hypothetical protein [Litoreibacter sp.]
MFGALKKLISRRDRGASTDLGDPGTAASNTAVRLHLSRQGDLGLTSRMVAHYMYPDAGLSLGPRSHVADIFAGIDGALSDAHERNGFVFEQKCNLHPDTFDVFTESLRRDLMELGWKYDGWECAVIKE